MKVRLSANNCIHPTNRRWFFERDRVLNDVTSTGIPLFADRVHIDREYPYSVVSRVTL